MGSAPEPKTRYGRTVKPPKENSQGCAQRSARPLGATWKVKYIATWQCFPTTTDGVTATRYWHTRQCQTRTHYIITRQ
jgi:hypothetical protein